MHLNSHEETRQKHTGGTIPKSSVRSEYTPRIKMIRTKKNQCHVIYPIPCLWWHKTNIGRGGEEFSVHAYECEMRKTEMAQRYTRSMKDKANKQNLESAKTDHGLIIADWNIHNDPTANLATLLLDHRPGGEERTDSGERCCLPVQNLTGGLYPHDIN